MTVERSAEIAAFVVFSLFVILLVLSAASVTVRIGRMTIRRERPPVLLWRDAVTFSGMSSTILIIAIARVLELPTLYTRTPIWIIGTSLPALVGLAVFLYYEWFVIGRD